MFDISAKLVAEQDEISGLEMIGWENHSWKYLSLNGDERIINLQRTKVYIFSDSVLCLGKIHQNTESNEAWKKRIEWITSSQSYRDFDGISGEPTEFEWNIFPGFDTTQLYGKVKDLLSRLGETPEIFTDAAVQETIETIFRIIVSANQLSLHGAVAEMCEEDESLHERTERPVVMGLSSSSLVLSAIKTEVLLDGDDPAYQNFLLQHYEERIERLSQQDRLSK